MPEFISCPVKGAKPVFLDDAMDYRILSAYLSFSDKCLFEWGEECFLIVINYLVINVHGVTWKMVF